jgi:hypothetical protein
VFGLLGVLIGAPLGWLGARWLAMFIAGIINSDVADLSVPASVLVLEVGWGCSRHYWRPSFRSFPGRA